MKYESKRPTIRDVARETKLSIATVSFVLNGKDKNIPEETQKKVLDAAKKIGYRPNRLAVGLVTNKTNIIGFICPDSGNLFFADLCRGIETAAQSFGYRIILGNTRNDSKKDMEYLRVFADQCVDGIIFAKAQGTKEDDENLLAFLRESQIPAVIVDRHINHHEIATVMLDHKQGGYLATKYLLSLGHRRIGCVTGPFALESALQRLEGYKTALEESGIQYDPTLVVEGAYQYQDGVDAFPILISKKITAVFACNDMMAFGIYKAAKDQGYAIPEDLSVVGFDDVPYCDILSPALTTIQQPIADIGAESVRLLVNAIQSNSAITEGERLFSPTLIVRKSCAECAKR